MTSARVVAAGSGGEQSGAASPAGRRTRPWCWILCAALAGCTTPASVPTTPTSERDEPPLPSAASLEGLTPADPFECRGDDEHVLDNVLIQTDANGVTIDGPCLVVIRRSHIAAGANGIEVFGTGRVQVIDSVVEGAENAVELHGAARLGARGSRFRGPFERSESARYIDGGGNLWEE